MPSVLVTGAGRGLGLEFCRQYGEAGWQVIAGVRKPEQAVGLTALTQRLSDLTVVPLDVADADSVSALAAQLGQQPLDVLINNAGIYGDSTDCQFGALDYARWAEVFRINTMGPVRVTEALLGRLMAGQRKLVVAITSLMGSIADNQSGGSIMYRSSKAALNAAMKSLAIDLRGRGIGVLILHPGWVRTDMGGPNAPTEAVESVAGMRAAIEAFRLQDSGRFLDYRGQELPW